MTAFRNRLTALLALVLTATGGSSVLADTRQYDIELLVFQNLVNSDAGEVWREEYRAWPDETGGELQEWLDSTAVDWLSAAQYRLGPHQASLRSSAQYRPLAHLAWRQTVPDRQNARPVRLPVSQPSVDGAYVDGNATVAVERYLHLSLDLALHMAAAAPAGGLLPAQAAAPFRLIEQRRMRSKELHYFDHPRFGVLALITPHQASSE